MVEAPPLLAWLETQIDADERLARDATSAWGSRCWYVHTDERGDVWLFDKSSTPVMVTVSASPEEPVRHIAAWDPKRALAECAAKRRVLTRHAPQQVVQHAGVRVCRCCAHIWPCPDVLDVAVVYQDRDGWHDGWAPRG